jgi:hypothetical protein
MGTAHSRQVSEHVEAMSKSVAKMQYCAYFVSCSKHEFLLKDAGVITTQVRNYLQVARSVRDRLTRLEDVEKVKDMKDIHVGHVEFVRECARDLFRVEENLVSAVDGLSARFEYPVAMHSNTSANTEKFHVDSR